MPERNRTYKLCDNRNNGEGYRRFHSSNALSSARETVVATMAHKWTGPILAVTSILGLICLITFWPG